MEPNSTPPASNTDSHLSAFPPSSFVIRRRSINTSASVKSATIISPGAASPLLSSLPPLAPMLHNSAPVFAPTPLSIPSTVVSPPSVASIAAMSAAGGGSGTVTPVAPAPRPTTAPPTPSFSALPPPTFNTSLDTSWRQFATDALLGASSTLDRCMKALPALQRAWDVHELEGADASRLLRDIALTLAALERALCAFATQQYQEAKEWDGKPSNLSSSGNSSNSSSTGSLVTVINGNTTQTTHPKHDWRYCGGLVPYMLFLRRLLSEVQVTLSKLSRASSLSRLVARYPLTIGAVSASPLALGLLGSTSLGQFIFRHVQSVVAKVMTWFIKLFMAVFKFQSKCATSLSGLSSNGMWNDVTTSWTSMSDFFIDQFRSLLETRPTLFRSVFNALQSAFRSLRSVLWTKRGLLFRSVLLMSSGVFLAHQARLSYVRFTLLPKLSAQHERLLLLLRVWHVSTSALFDDASHARPAGDHSVATAETPISLWLLSRVPPSLNSSFWFEHPLNLRLLRRALDVTYCTVDVWQRYASMHSAAAPLAIVVAWYFWLRPTVAADRNTALLSVADPHWLRAAWQMLDSPQSRVIVAFLLPALRLTPSLALEREIVLCSSQTDGNSYRAVSVAPFEVADPTPLPPSQTKPTSPSVQASATDSNPPRPAPILKQLPVRNNSSTRRPPVSLKNGTVLSPITASPLSLTSTGTTSPVGPMVSHAQPLSSGVNESESNIISPSMVATLRTPLHSMIASMGSSGSRLVGPTEADLVDALSSRLSSLSPSQSVIALPLGGPSAPPLQPLLVHVYSIRPLSHYVASNANVAPPSSLPKESLHSEQFEIGESTMDDELPEGPPVVLYLHGGGWLSHFMTSDLVLLSGWAHRTKLPIVSVNYSLAPHNNRFPTALRECLAAYKWILNGGLRFRPSRVSLIGDSIGGNLAAALCLRCRDEGLPSPAHLVLAYPVLDLRSVVSPSRLLFQMCPIAPASMRAHFRSLYVPPSCSDCSDQQHMDCDPLVSPALASIDLLRRLPPTSIMAAGLDPLLDDSVLFAHRLHDAGVRVRLQYCGSLPHSFFNFSLVLADAQEATMQCIDWATERETHTE